MELKVSAPAPVLGGQVERFEFEDPRYPLSEGSWCWLETVRAGHHFVACVTDPGVGLDSGLSVTNAAETLASLIRGQNGVLPGHLVWLERYLGPSGIGPFDEHIDRVTFSWDGGQASQPVWVRLVPGQVADVLHALKIYE